MTKSSGRAERKRFREIYQTQEIHLLDAGHFALESEIDDIAGFIVQFLRGTLHDEGA